MIEYGRLEAAAGGVADPAILGCQNVADVHSFRRARAIGYMTGIAARGQHSWIVMVDKRIGKTNRVMAQRTIGRGYRVRWSGGLCSGPERNKATIVTGDTISGDTLVGQHRCRREPGNGMANVTILGRRHMVHILDQFGASVAWQRQELTGMAAFAAVGDGIVNVRQKSYRWRKIARIGRRLVMAHNAFIQCRNMVGFLAYGPDRNIVGITTVAGFTVAVDTATAMGKVGCIRE